MTHAAVDELLERYWTAESVEDAVTALRELATLDATDLEAGAAHDPIGDLYAELAADLFDQDVVDEAFRLQEFALDHPCTNRWREIGTMLGYRFVGGEDEGAIAQLVELKTGEVTDAYLLSAFAEAVEADAPELSLDRYDEALAVAKAAGDPNVLIAVQTPRALARQEAGLPEDADDTAGFDALDALNAEIRAAEVAEAKQLFVRRDGIEAFTARWPELADEIGLSDVEAYFAGLEELWQLQPLTGNALELYPIVVELFDRFDAEPGRIVDDLPEPLQVALDEADLAEVWPPGRNDVCWCGSGRKYKRCCGAA